MIDISNIEVFGFKAAIRGMRNPYESWDESDSLFDLESYYNGNGGRNICGNIIEDCDCEGTYLANEMIGNNDIALMLKLAKVGPVYSEYRRMITVYMDVSAPLYWWEEFDTYKEGTVSISCNTIRPRKTVMLNYEILANIYASRKDNNLDEWRSFCEVIKTLPLSNIITLEE